MWLEKFLEGVFCIQTPLGPRYLRPNFWHRLYLMWIFRHFSSLPPQVLKTWERRFLESLCHSATYVSPLRSNGLEDAPVIGALENRIPVMLEPEGNVAERPERRAAGTPVADEQGTS
jgi:hypothetical protein